jgi:hypothetical protein
MVGRMIPHLPLRDGAWRTKRPAQRCASITFAGSFLAAMHPLMLGHLVGFLVLIEIDALR